MKLPFISRRRHEAELALADRAYIKTLANLETAARDELQGWEKRARDAEHTAERLLREKRMLQEAYESMRESYLRASGVKQGPIPGLVTKGGEA